MSLREFAGHVKTGGFGENDKKWFPAWLRRYAEYVKQSGESRLPLTRESAVEFSVTLRKNQVPAWQRRQAVRALIAYRDLVLKTEDPQLLDMVTALNRMAEQEKQLGAEGRPGIRDEAHLVGQIDPHEAPILQQVRREIRVQGKALTTERAYVGWIERFLKYCGIDTSPREEFEGLASGLPSRNRAQQSEARIAKVLQDRAVAMVSEVSESDIRNYLTMLAVKKNVAPNTQGQAKAALLFLFQDVVGRELGFLDTIAAWQRGSLKDRSAVRHCGFRFPEFGFFHFSVSPVSVAVAPHALHRLCPQTVSRMVSRADVLDAVRLSRA